MISYLLAILESDEDKLRLIELYEEHHVRVEQTALRILKDPHDAEDAVQNTFLQVIRHFDKISEIPCKKLGFWLISIAKNEALMILRHKRRRFLRKTGILFRQMSAIQQAITSLSICSLNFPDLPFGAGNAADQRLLRQGNCTASWDLRVRGQYAHFSWPRAAS